MRGTEDPDNPVRFRAPPRKEKEMKYLIAVIVLSMCACSGIKFEYEGEGCLHALYKTWEPCQDKACNEKCKDGGMLGGHRVKYNQVAEIARCECYLREGTKERHYSFDELGCGGYPKECK